MANEEIEIRWRAIDPQQNEVVLKSDTYQFHILDDHDEKDSAQRSAIEKQAKITIEKPYLILQSQQNETRAEYINLSIIPDEDKLKLRCLTVIVDTSTDPYEVVTWIPQNKLKTNFLKEEVIYDGKNNSPSCE